MPELPEVDTVRRTLLPRVLGREVQRVVLRRREVVTGPSRPRDLLAGCRLGALCRLGKQLAIVGAPPRSGDITPVRGDERVVGSPELDENPAPHPDAGPVVCVHLGMTGSVCYLPPKPTGSSRPPRGPHQHVLWQLSCGGWMVFTDPRRFGGLWTFPDFAALQARRWAPLGPDALAIQPRQLYPSLQATRRPIKASLLDQHLVAGLGNIYVDELLFACGLHPLTTSSGLDFAQIQKMVVKMRRILGRSIDRGGTTIRDYVDGVGRNGWFKLDLKVYGRSGEPCRRCDAVLEKIAVIGRTTVFCPCCQALD